MSTGFYDKGLYKVMQRIDKKEKIMTPENFCYWLQGFYEILSVGPKTAIPLTLNAEQTAMIHKHLKSVFSETIMQPTITFNPPLAPMPTYPLPQQPVFPDLTPAQPFPISPYTVTCQAGIMGSQADLAKGGVVIC